MEDLIKEIEDEKEQLSQKVRNWTGSEILYSDMRRTLERLRFKFEQHEIYETTVNNVENEKDIDSE